jgi:hypothetical protein
MSFLAAFTAAGSVVASLSMGDLADGETALAQAQAKKEYDQLVAEKTKKGYLEK